MATECTKCGLQYIVSRVRLCVRLLPTYVWHGIAISKLLVFQGLLGAELSVSIESCFTLDVILVHVLLDAFSRAPFVE